MPETIGQRLKQIRLSRQLTIEKAAEATRVRAVYLQALENDDYSAMSSAAQGRGFLRNYADFLGLDLEAAMTDMRQPETPTPLAPDVTADAPAPAPASPADEKPGRRGFWSRLLRRSAPEAQAEAEIPSEPLAVVVEPAPEPEAPKPVRAPRAKKPAAKTAKAVGKTSGKKKAPMKSRSKR